MSVAMSNFGNAACWLWAGAFAVGAGGALIAGTGAASAETGSEGGGAHATVVSTTSKQPSVRASRSNRRTASPRASTARPAQRFSNTPTASTSRVGPLTAFLFNRTPTLNPVRLGQDSAGVVTGNLNVNDAEGNAVTISITRNPLNGTVTVDDAGRYTYTPDRLDALTGTTDSFAVSVSDAGAGFHMHGLVGLLSLLTLGLIRDPGHSVTTTVAVVVHATSPPPGPPSVERRIHATATDPDITAAPGSGEAAHVVINPSPVAIPTGQLVVFLPGTQGKPEQYTEILRAAAGWGFHAVGLNYPNQTAVGSLCGDSADTNCYWNARTDVLFGDGTPVAGQSDVTPADSIVNRLDKLLLSMQSNHPDEGWGQFLLSDDTVDWSKVVLAGHSQGGGHAAVMAKTVSLSRAVYFSAPADWNNLTDQPADWTLSKPNVTPASRQYGFGSDSDRLVPNADAFAIWDNLGLAEPASGPVLVDTASAPYAGSHQLRTALTFNPASTAPGTLLKNHGITVVDASTPVNASGTPIFSTNGVWAYLLGAT